MALEVITPCAEIPCPQCGAHGVVPAADYGRTRWCKLCKGEKFTTVEHCLEAGWPADVLAEVTTTNKGNVAAAMLIAPEID